MTKRQIRSKMLARLKLQKEEDRDRKSRLIKNKLFGIRAFRKAKTVMFYIAFGGEVNTKEMIKEALNLGKKVAVPVVAKNCRMMQPCLLDHRGHLVRGPYGVWEPAIKRAVKLKELDLVIVPGVAFNRKGKRLGRGKGCYDYFVNRLPKKTSSVGLAFNFQILPDLPATSNDVSVNRVIFA